MAEKTAQTYQNHARLIPLYHYVALPVLLINALWALYQLTQGVVGESAIALAVAVALLLIAFYARVFALAAQDRIIHCYQTTARHESTATRPSSLSGSVLRATVSSRLSPERCSTTTSPTGRLSSRWSRAGGQTIKECKSLDQPVRGEPEATIIQQLPADDEGGSLRTEEQRRGVHIMHLAQPADRSQA